MNDKIQKLLDSMEYSDLLKFRDDVTLGSPIYLKLIEQKLNEVENTHRKICASCGNNLNSTYDIYTLLFGERTIRKKASFCGMDCLHEFTAKLSINNQESLKKTLLE